MPKNGAYQNVCHQRVDAWHFEFRACHKVLSTFFKLSLYTIYWELNTNVWHASTVIILTAGNWQLAECQDE